MAEYILSLCLYKWTVGGATQLPIFIKCVLSHTIATYDFSLPRLVRVHHS